MEIKILTKIPEEWKNKKPIEEYETTLMYTGFSRYDTKKSLLSRIERKLDGRLLYSSNSWTGVLSKCYHTENVRVTVYSTSPAMWSETVSIDNPQFFVQQQDMQTSSTP